MKFDYPYAWYHRVAHSLGVPDMWLDDAIQVMRLAAWQGHNVRFACIDFMRQHICDDRYSRRATFGAFEDWKIINPDYGYDTLLDLRRLFQRLNRRLQFVVLGYLYGYKDVELARKMGVSPRRVGQLRGRGLALLREGLI